MHDIIFTHLESKSEWNRMSDWVLKNQESERRNVGENEMSNSYTIQFSHQKKVSVTGTAKEKTEAHKN